MTSDHGPEQLPCSSVSLQEIGVRINERDDVAVVKRHLEAGTRISWQEGREERSTLLRQSIPGGHKFALREIPLGDPVLRYGEVIGFAVRDISAGEHVHTHNLGLRDYRAEYRFGQCARPVEYACGAERRHFHGYVRADGRVGTRNHIAVIATVSCSAHVCRAIAHSFTAPELKRYPSVDRVLAVTHQSGCAQRQDGVGLKLLRRTLCGIARHPNVGACVIVGLGCETNQIADLLAECELVGSDTPVTLVIQELGGIAETVQEGVAAVQELLPKVNRAERVAVWLSKLKLALQCGGSDAWSGLTANPLVGLVSDQVVRQGGTVVLAETPEILGAEHLLTQRAVNGEVGADLIELVRGWEDRARREGIDMDENRSAGNAAGGLTTLFEKALGGVAKAGSTPLTATYEYAEPVTERGFVFMNSPGFDPVSVTGQVGGGCNLVLFTTGRGSVSASLVAPTIKISSNSATYERLRGDMDFNAGEILDGVDAADAADELLELVITAASGQPTRSEAQRVGEAEFSPWRLGETL